jgi:DNA alkylation damage repair protein AlkB
MHPPGTVFRESERRYRRFRCCSVSELGPEVINPRSGARPDGRLIQSRLAIIGGRQRPVLEHFRDGIFPTGLYIIPSVLKQQEQVALIARTLSSYVNGPNKTNLDAHYILPPGGLFQHLLLRNHSDPLIFQMNSMNAKDSSNKSSNPRARNTIGAMDLFRRLRWATIGLQYDWTSKKYPALELFKHDNCVSQIDVLSSDPPIPLDLDAWSRDLMCAAGFNGWRAEAGIVNIYGPGDSLTGHTDHSEVEISRPLLSVSLGAPCIFLIGGPSREDPVSPVLLRSGDCLIMSGESRRSFHGVPCILKCEDSTLSSQHSIVTDGGGDEPIFNYNAHPYFNAAEDEINTALEILGPGRININLRQVF